MKNVSHTRNNVTKKLLVAALTLATLSPFSLDAMKRPLEDGQLPAFKRQKTEKKTVILICNDGIEITSDFNLLVKYLEPIKNTINDLGGIQNTPDKLVVRFTSNTWNIMIQCMELIDKEQANKINPDKLVDNLIAIIKPQAYSSEILKDCHNAADFYNFKPLYHALCKHVAQGIHDNDEECLKLWPKNPQPTHWIQYPQYLWTQFVTGTQPQLNCNISRTLETTYYCSFNRHLSMNNPIEITLHGLVECGLLSVSNDVISLNKNLEQYILFLITTSEHQTLQTTLDKLSKYATPLSIKAHEVLVAHVRSLTKEQIKELFETLKDHGESTLKMALRLVSAKDHSVNLDGLKCDLFFKNIGHWVNGHTGYGLATTELFSPTYLQHVLPLIEPVTGIVVIALTLDNNELTSLPDTICNLVNLELLSFIWNNLICLPDSIGNLVKLTRIYLFMGKLTSLPDSMSKLSNLKELNLYGNKLTSLPATIGNLFNLTSLNLSKNKLTSLPDSMSKLRNLTLLDLSHNELPNGIKDKFKEQFGHIGTFSI